MIINQRVQLSLITILTLVLICFSCDSNVNNDKTSKTIGRVNFPNPPIMIETNIGADKAFINYFTILQISDSLFYMYYSAFPKDVSLETDWNQNVYFAYSTDGFHYIHKKIDGSDNLLLTNVVEPMAFYIPNNSNPYRLIGNVQCDITKRTYEHSSTLYMWESKDGLSFDNPRILADDISHDSQNVMLVYDKKMKLYARTWKWGYNKDGRYLRINRKISVAEFDHNGNQLSNYVMLDPDYVYNSAASVINGKEIIFPTIYNDLDGTDSCYVKSFWVEGIKSTELDCNFSTWIKDSEKWVMLCPGFLNIKGKNYIAYTTVSSSHENHSGIMETKYYLIEVLVE